MQNRSLLLALLIFCGLVAASSCSNSRGRDRPGRVEASANGLKAVAVQLVPVKRQELHRTVEAVGSLFADEEVVVSSEVEGKASDVLVDVGDRVTQGQVLVRVSPTELQLAFEQQKAALEQVRARLGLKEGETTLQDIREAAAVKKAAADLADTDQKYQRAKELLDQGLVPRQSYDEAEARHKSAQANYDLALQEVRNLLALLRQYTATSELAQKKLRDTEIRAPFSGYVKERSVAPGQYLRVQTPVLSLVRVDPLRARIKIPEKMSGWIPIGQAVTISVDAFPYRHFTGKISRMNPAVDPQTRSFEAEALVQNAEGLLRPGFFVKASIQSDRTETLLTIPNPALTYAYGVYSAYVAKGGRLQQREVKIGERMGDEVEIVSGVSEGEEVAVSLNPAQQLYDGAPVGETPAEDEPGASSGGSGPAGRGRRAKGNS